MWNGGEGWGISTIAPGADQWYDQLTAMHAANMRGRLPMMSLGSNAPSKRTQIQKRSFKRAFRRATQHGYSWYRGQCWALRDFPKDLVPRDTKLQQPAQGSAQTSNSFQAPTRRLKLFQWNPSGLSIGKLDELCHWLSAQNINAVVLSETRWTMISEWMTSEWAVIHSGNPAHRGSGVMVLIRRSFCSPSQVAWSSLMDGHILHVRLHCCERPIDLIACYQFMDDRSSSRQRQRAEFWTILEDYVSRLPNRNELILTGDFNCGVSYMAGQVGMAEFYWQGHLHAGKPHADTDRLMKIIGDNGLVVLNSWKPQLGPTFVHDSMATRIDLIMTRFCHTDWGAKNVQTIPDAPFIDNPQYCHIPLIAHLPCIRIMNRSHSKLGFNCADRRFLRQEWKEDSDRWHQLVAHAQLQLTHFVDKVDHSEVDLIHHIHDQIRPVVTRFMDSQSVKCFPRDSAQIHRLESKWEHFRQARAGSEVERGLTQWFKRWFHLARFSRLCRGHRKHAKLQRKQRFHDAVQEANDAASRFDQYRLHQIIRSFAPKAPRRRIQLRNSRGTLANPVEELAIFRQYVKDMWTSTAPVVMIEQSPPGVPFSESELCEALSSIPVNKAVATPFLPGLVIRALAKPLATHVFSLLTNWWNQSPPFVPAHWKDGWLVWGQFETPCIARTDRQSHCWFACSKAVVPSFSETLQVATICISPT